MKKIKILETGGTISAKGINRLDLKDYQSGVFQGPDFLAAMPELATVADITFEAFLRVSSTAINSNHWIHLRQKIINSLEKDCCDGIVITHGTNTLEETAYFLHLTLPTTKPIVLVGSQRPFTALSSDAHLNILQAVRVAASDEATGKGVLVVLNDEINSAREVTKSNTYRLQTFQAGQFGLLGYIDPDQKVHFYREPTKKHTIQSDFSALALTSLPKVEIIYSYAGATGQFIDYLIDSNKISGIVTAGTGAGLVSPTEQQALEKAVQQGITVVRSSRVGNGRVMPISPYDGTGFIAGDNLLPQKARILLMLSLLKYHHMQDIQGIFDTH